MAEYEIITRGGHTYKRRKGSRDQWIDENGNVVDLSSGERRVTRQASARIGSGNNSANPDVWIVNGKAYSDGSHGGYKTSYFNAIKTLGQNLGWNVKRGSQSEKNLKAQNKKFNASKTKLSRGSIGRITDNGNVGFIDVQNDENPLQIRPAQNNSYDENPNVGFAYPQDEISASSYATDVAQRYSQGGTLYKKYFI